MGVFRKLYPEKKINALTKIRKKFQTYLNDCHHLHLQHETLIEFKNKMLAEQRMTFSAMEALDLLIEDREKELSKKFRKFSSQLKPFAQKKVEAAFRELFSAKSPNSKGKKAKRSAKAS